MEDDKKQNADTQTATDDVQNQEQEAGNKNEGTKAKEQSKSKSGITKNDDGSITFESQEKFEEFASKMFRKGADKVEQNSKQTQEIQNVQNAQQEEASQEQAIPQDYTDKIALAMAKAGVDVQKVERAARLVDTSKILENGVLNTTKLEEEINAVVAEFPELKNTREEEKEGKGFKFGATQSNSDGTQKQKRPVATKRWNRFNSF